MYEKYPVITERKKPPSSLCKGLGGCVYNNATAKLPLFFAVEIFLYLFPDNIGNQISSNKLCDMYKNIHVITSHPLRMVAVT